MNLNVMWRHRPMKKYQDGKVCWQTHKYDPMWIPSLRKKKPSR